jgi:hypothetical protein
VSETRVPGPGGQADVYLGDPRNGFSDVVLELPRFAISRRCFAISASIVLAAKIGDPVSEGNVFAAPSLEWVQTASAGVDHLLPLTPGDGDLRRGSTMKS